MQLYSIFLPALQVWSICRSLRPMAGHLLLKTRGLSERLQQNPSSFCFWPVMQGVPRLPGPGMGQQRSVVTTSTVFFLLSLDCFKDLADETPEASGNPTGQPPLRSEVHRSPSRTLPRALTHHPPGALLTLDNQNCSVSYSFTPPAYTQYTRCCTQ